MRDIEEAEVLDNGGVVIRYYFGKTILIPAGVMEKEGITITCLNQTVRRSESLEWIKKQPGRSVNGRV